MEPKLAGRQAVAASVTGPNVCDSDSSIACGRLTVVTSDSVVK